MPEWSDRRARSLTADVSQFLEGLGHHPKLRQRLAAQGYTEQMHRGLGACLARLGDLSSDSAEGRSDAAAGRGTGLDRALGWGPAGLARAVVGWAVHQARLASAAARKAPSVVDEIRRVAAGVGEEPPWETFRASRRVLERIGADDHLSQFLTLSGLRDVSLELRRRLREGGSPAARSARLQAHGELAFLFARCRQMALRELGGEPSALRALGIQPG